MLLRLSQDLNALAPMLVTLDGISMLRRMTHNSNALFPMRSSWLPSANVTLVRLTQFRNAKSPMVVTLAGISMLPRLPQSSKAMYPMVVTPFSMTTLLMLFW